MKIISLNIELSRHHELVLPFLKQEKADIICLQEVLEEDFEMYKKELAMDGFHRSTSYITDSVHTESYGKKEGLAIFSNNIINHGYVFHVGTVRDIERPFGEYILDKDLIKNRAMLWVDVLNEDNSVYKFATSHLTITHHGEVTSSQLEANQVLIKQLKELGEFVFCGDTNAPRGSEAFDTISKEFKDNIPLKYKTSLDPFLHRVKGLEYMVDGLFTTPSYEASSVRLKDGVSDHMAVIADVNKL